MPLPLEYRDHIAADSWGLLCQQLTYNSSGRFSSLRYLPSEIDSGTDSHSLVRPGSWFTSVTAPCQAIGTMPSYGSLKDPRRGKYSERLCSIPSSFSKLM